MKGVNGITISAKYSESGSMASKKKQQHRKRQRWHQSMMCGTGGGEGGGGWWWQRPIMGYSLNYCLVYSMPSNYLHTATTCLHVLTYLTCLCVYYMAYALFL